MNAFDVLDFLKVNENKKYKSYQIAKVFGVSTQTMTMTLTALGSQIESDLAGKHRDFWFMSDEVRKQRQDRQAEYQAKISKAKTVYKPPQSLIDAQNRCKEIYPNGGNFKSIC